MCSEDLKDIRSRQKSRFICGKRPEQDNTRCEGVCKCHKKLSSLKYVHQR